MENGSYIIGLSAYYHDSSATFLKNGRIQAVAQEERFTRRKGDAGFPLNAIQYCLYEAGIDTPEVDYIAFYENPAVKFDCLFETYGSLWPNAVKLFTDFNIRGKPIVCGPEHAYKCFMATGMDCLVIDKFLLMKENQPAGLLPELDYYKTSVALD